MLKILKTEIFKNQTMFYNVKLKLPWDFRDKGSRKGYSYPWWVGESSWQEWLVIANLGFHLDIPVKREPHLRNYFNQIGLWSVSVRHFLCKGFLFFENVVHCLLTIFMPPSSPTNSSKIPFQDHPYSSISRPLTCWIPFAHPWTPGSGPSTGS